MRTWWSKWVARCARTEDPLPLALVRVFVCLCIVGDVLRVWSLGLVGVIWRPYESGGLTAFSSPWGLLGRWPETAGPAAAVVVVVSLSLAALGVAARPAMLVGLVAYAQLGHLYPPGDRAIDRLLRTALLVLLFSGAHRRLALTGPRQAAIPAWPGGLLRFVLVLVYLGAGVAKLVADPHWLSPSGVPVLYRVLASPIDAHIDPIAATNWFWPIRLLGFGTIALELSSPLLLTRWARWWAVAGIGMHLGIAATMELGMFAWGMLAFYPLFLVDGGRRER